MKYHQRDIVELHYPTPNGKLKARPAIIVSQDETNDIEGRFYALMMTSQNFHSEVTFEVTADMLNYTPNERSSFVTCHLLDPFYEDEVLRRFGTMKIQPFNDLLEKAKDVIFGGNED